MKKNILLLSLFLSISFNGISQDTATRTRTLLDMISHHYVTLKNLKDVNLKNVQGSPYESNDFQIGTIFHKISGQKIKAFLRYNAYSDEIEVKKENTGEDVSNLIKNPNIIVILNDKEYHLKQFTTIANNNSEGFLIKEPETPVFYKLSKEYIPATKAKTSYHPASPAKFKNIKNYFLEINDEVKEVIQHKSKVVSAFPYKHRDALKSFIKKEKLKFKKEDDLVQLIAFYNTIKKG